METLEEMFEQATRNQHYVKKEYLRNWSNDGTNIKGRSKSPKITRESFSLENICVEKDIYQIKKLSDDEIKLLESFNGKQPLPLKKYNEAFINYWQTASAMSEIVENEKTKAKMCSQLGEDIQTSFENCYKDTIKEKLLKYDDSFLSNDELKENLLIFLFSQYLRTQKQKEKVIEASKRIANNPISITENFWKVFIAIGTNSACYHLMGIKIHIGFIVSHEEKLMTSDQPIVNISAADESEKFYYPVSPKVGIIYPCKEYYVERNNEKLISELNNKILDKAQRFYFYR